jgi:hypothetical protein
MLASGIGYDEQVFVWGGWSILKGLAPYRDFMEWKPPVAFLTHALALKLFGFEGERFRYFFLVLSMSSVLALVASLIKRRADVVICSAFGIALVHMFLFPGYHETFVADTESIGLSYYYFGVAALIANTRHRVAAEIAGGVFLSFCVLSKEPFAPCVVATWATCYFALHERFSWPCALRYLRNTSIGVGLVIAGLSLYMVPTGSMSAYIALVRRYSTMFRDPHKGYCAVLGFFNPTGRFWDDLPQQWARIHAQFANVATLGFLAPFFAACAALVPRRSPILFAGGMTAIAMSLYGVTATNCFFQHYFVLGESGLMFFLATGVDAIRPRLSSNATGIRLWVRSMVFLAMAISIWPQIEAASDLKLRDGPPPAEPIPGIFEFVRQNSTPADKIFTTGPPALYFVVDRLPAVRGCTMIDELIPAMPGETDAEKLRPLYEELAKNQPKIVFLDPEHGNRKYRHMAAAISPFLADFKYTKISEMIYVRPPS